MTKISNRLLALTQFVDKKDTIVDVGCDHGLLSIYLVENKLCKSVIASDVNQNALNNAINNIKKRKLNIPTFLSDGINNIPMKGLNTIIISGMGTSTIMHILSESDKIKNINKIIIQSNNNHETLRRFMNEMDYYMDKEIVIFDKGKWYITYSFIKSVYDNTEKELKYGYLSNDKYNKYMCDDLNKIIKKIPIFSINRWKKSVELYKLKRAIKNK
ncbi:MAG: tRNA (adenine(22)-N(1))-methyltransferase TrmK [Candidatus Coprovivens sp.]